MQHEQEGVWELSAEKSEKVDVLRELQKRLYTELDNYIVKDTYTKGKNAGIRKALALINDKLAEQEVLQG